VAVAAYTGMCRNEILSLRWTDFDEASATLKVERALEHTKAGIKFKPPKTERGKPTVKIDADLASLLNTEREKQQRACRMALQWTCRWSSCPTMP